MKQQPTIETERLILRPLELSDAFSMQLLAGDHRIADTTESIPHPYEEGMAEKWIQSLHSDSDAQNHVAFAVSLKEQSGLIGCCGLSLVAKHRRASLGYWIGFEYWGKGFCTEAASAIVRFGFDQLEIHRIEATHLTRNPASGAVM